MLLAESWKYAFRNTDVLAGAVLFSSLVLGVGEQIYSVIMLTVFFAEV